MATIAQLLDEMADQIRASVVAVLDVDVQVEPRMVLNPTGPTIDMWVADPSMDSDVAAFSQLVGGEVFTVRARVGTPDNYAAQDLLLAFMDDEDPLSILLAIHDDLTLNGLTSNMDVRNRSGYRLFPVEPNSLQLGCEWEVVVIKAKS